MDWLWGVALLPALLCGLMCVGGVVVATVGQRRVKGRRARGDDHPATEAAGHDERTPRR